MRRERDRREEETGKHTREHARAAGAGHRLFRARQAGARSGDSAGGGGEPRAPAPGPAPSRAPSPRLISGARAGGLGLEAAAAGPYCRCVGAAESAEAAAWRAGRVAAAGTARAGARGRGLAFARRALGTPGQGPSLRLACWRPQPPACPELGARVAPAVPQPSPAPGGLAFHGLGDWAGDLGLHQAAALEHT